MLSLCQKPLRQTLAIMLLAAAGPLAQAQGVPAAAPATARTASPAQAAPSGRDIVQRARQADTHRDVYRRYLMTIERDGVVLRRGLESYSMRLADESRGLLVFHEPSDARGIKYLTWNYDDIARDDDMWMFLPSERIVRRIAGSARRGSFMRSDLLNEDLQDRSVDDDAHQWLRSEACGEAICQVIESRPVRSDVSEYARRVTWVREDLWLPVKVEYMDRGGQLVKTASYLDFQRFGDVWSRTRTVVTSADGRSRTTLLAQETRINGGLAARLFEHASLR